jgi:hypothetical protein
MTLITREAKGSKLSFKEMDGNLTYLEELAQQGGTGITSSFQIGFIEFLIENGLITQENEIWTYQGVLKVGIDTSGGDVSKYMYGYTNKGLGFINPTSTLAGIVWVEQHLEIGTIFTTIGKVIIDEGEASELILEASDFNVSNGMAISGVISNPFPVEGGTHTIKIQYT